MILNRHKNKVYSTHIVAEGKVSDCCNFTVEKNCNAITTFRKSFSV